MLASCCICVLATLLSLIFRPRTLPFWYSSSAELLEVESRNPFFSPHFLYSYFLLHARVILE